MTRTSAALLRLSRAATTHRARVATNTRRPARRRPVLPSHQVQVARPRSSLASAASGSAGAGGGAIASPAPTASDRGLTWSAAAGAGYDWTTASPFHASGPYRPGTVFFSSSSPAPPPDDGNTGDEKEVKAEAGATTTDDAPSPSSEEKGDDDDAPRETLEFQAETRQLLDIVTHSIYTDKEVFLRELISNASDALEKLRHVQVTNEKTLIDSDAPLEIRVETNEADGTLTITDTGIGLTREEMISNLGTIARSGSKAFVKEMSKGSEGSAGMEEKAIIGKFGVGFYSSFMVGDAVEVRSRSAVQVDDDDSSSPLVWKSEGVGTFDISDLPPTISQDRGSSVVIQLKGDDVEYCDEKRIEGILKKYSNFVNFPILLNGNRVNTMEAVWTLDPNSVSEDTHSAFYKYVANAYDEPLTHLHFRSDAPLEVRALFYVPSFHTEKHGMGRMEPGVSLYSRKVLIEARSPDILPEWMRFVKGVVDSEDLPLSISREKAQDTALIRKLRNVLTRKFINHLSTMARKDPSKYKDEFFKEYGFFLKEGICQDFEFQDQLSKLLYFETSKTMDGEMSSLDEYVSRCTPEQKEIYYLCAPSRELALDSPYLEAFEKAGREVIFVYSAIDDFVMSNLTKFQDRPLVTAEKGDLDLGSASTDGDKKGEGEGGEASAQRLGDQEATEFCAWFQITLSDKVAKAKVTDRLGASPAVITDHESGALRRMMRMVDSQAGATGAMVDLSKQTVEVNPGHPIVVGLNAIRETEPALAKVCAEQVFDNCLVAAGLLDDGRSMLPRLNDILLCAVKGAEAKAAEGTQPGMPSEKLESAADPSDTTQAPITTEDSSDKSGDKEVVDSVSSLKG